MARLRVQGMLAARGWDAVVCCLLCSSVCTGFVTSVKLNTWPVEDKGCFVQGRRLSEGEKDGLCLGTWLGCCLWSRDCWSW